MKEVKNNLTIAFSASKLADSRTALSVFEHNLEFVARINLVNYINDSKATAVNDTWNSLQIMNEDVVLILGCTDLRSDYGILQGLVREKVKAIICLGTERERIFSALMHLGFTVYAESLEEAVTLSAQLAKPGSTVLFSPGCPSFGAFDNYKNRGDKFKELVNALA
ncbi:MAG: glutamate ligase domain-containing protein [Bacteroidia bacterium]